MSHRGLIATLLVSLLFATVGFAQSANDSSITVTFAVDGKIKRCGHGPKVEIISGGRRIQPKSTSKGFFVSEEVLSLISPDPNSEKTVEVNVICDDYTVNFPDMYASWLSPKGQWQVGVAYPPRWITRVRGLEDYLNGMWISYIEYDCFGCDPGVIATHSHPDAPQRLVRRLVRQQRAASGQKARDVAYALAVFRIEYHKNRDYLLHQLRTCLSRPRDSDEDAVCDETLLDYLTNLYWRGDDSLLLSLLQAGDDRKDVIDSIGYFYANLLDRRTAAIVNGLRELSTEQQQKVCRLAGNHGLTSDQPKLQRVMDNLHGIGGDVADQCSKVAEEEAKYTPWVRKAEQTGGIR